MVVKAADGQPIVNKPLIAYYRSSHPWVTDDEEAVGGHE
jgi:hypothetical protein